MLPMIIGLHFVALIATTSGCLGDPCSDYCYRLPIAKTTFANSVALSDYVAIIQIEVPTSSEVFKPDDQCRWKRGTQKFKCVRILKGISGKPLENELSAFDTIDFACEAFLPLDFPSGDYLAFLCLDNKDTPRLLGDPIFSLFPIDERGMIPCSLFWSDLPFEFVRIGPHDGEYSDLESGFWRGARSIEFLADRINDKNEESGKVTLIGGFATGRFVERRLGPENQLFHKTLIIDALNQSPWKLDMNAWYLTKDQMNDVKQSLLEGNPNRWYVIKGECRNGLYFVDSAKPFTTPSDDLAMLTNPENSDFE